MSSGRTTTNHASVYGATLTRPGFSATAALMRSTVPAKGAGTPPTLPTPRTARGGDEPERDRRPRQSAEPRSGGPVRFVQEAYGELKKVEWPGQNQVIQGTVVVLIACAVVGAYLYVNDQVWKQVVSKLFLGQ